MVLVEKVVASYTRYFKATDPRRIGAEFWEGLFLLRVNSGALGPALRQATPAHCNEMSRMCLEVMQGSHEIRIVHATETLVIIMTTVFGDLRRTSGSFGIDAVAQLCGLANVDQFFPTLVTRTKELLAQSTGPPVKRAVLSLLLAMITATDNINQNILIEYLLLNRIGDALLKVCVEVVTRYELAMQYLAVLMALTHYKRYEMRNPYVECLAAIQEPVIGHSLCEGLDWVAKQALVRGQPPEESTLSWLVASMYSVWGSASQHGQGGEAGAGQVVQVVGRVESIDRSLAAVAALSLYNLAKHTPRISKFFITDSARSQRRGQGSSTGPRHLNTCRIANLLSLFSHLFTEPIVPGDLKREREGESIERLALLGLSVVLEREAVCQLFCSRVLSTEIPLAEGLGAGTVDSSWPTCAGAVLATVSAALARNSAVGRRWELAHLAVNCIHRLLHYSCSNDIGVRCSLTPVWRALMAFLSHTVASDLMSAEPKAIAAVVDCLRVLNLCLTEGQRSFPLALHSLQWEVFRSADTLQGLAAAALLAAHSQARLLGLLRNLTLLCETMDPHLKGGDLSGETDTDVPTAVKQVLSRHAAEIKFAETTNSPPTLVIVENPHHTSFFHTFLRLFMVQSRLSIRLTGT